jgi:hypothetical protein
MIISFNEIYKSCKLKRLVNISHSLAATILEWDANHGHVLNNHKQVLKNKTEFLSENQSFQLFKKLFSWYRKLPGILNRKMLTLYNNITCVMIFSCNKPHVRYVSWSPRKQKIKRMASCIVLWVCCKAWEDWDVACWRPSALIKGSGPARQSLIAVGKHPGPGHLNHVRVYYLPGRDQESPLTLGETSLQLTECVV